MYLVRSGGISGYENFARQFGCNPVELLGRVGLTPAQLRNSNDYIAYRAMVELLELSGHASGDPYFGLIMSQRQNSTILGDMFMSVLQQPTAQQAVDSVRQYLYLHARGAHLHQQDQGEDTILHLTMDVHSDDGVDQVMQMSVGQLCNFISELLDLRQPAFPILLKQSPPLQPATRLDQRTLERIEFDMPVDGVRIPHAWLQRQPHYDEQAMRAHFRDYLDALRQRYPDNLRDQVKDIVSQLLPSNECSLERVADTLDLHPRVLQQRLQALDSNYGELLRETRQQVAEQHLRYPSTVVTELAFRLGYAEVSAFSRSFKQWTGLSPRQWQQRHAEEAGASST